MRPETLHFYKLPGEANTAGPQATVSSKAREGEKKSLPTKQRLHNNIQLVTIITFKDFPNNFNVKYVTTAVNIVYSAYNPQSKKSKENKTQLTIVPLQ